MSRARRYVANRAAVAGAIVIVLLLGVAILAPWLGKDPLAHDIENGLSQLGAPLSPSGNALLGTDHLGRDVWARLAAGATTSLAIAALATALALAIGLTIGLVAGYVGGWVDNGLMRTVDLVLSFPALLLAVLLAALLREAGLAPSIAPVVLTLGIVSWTTMARVIRGKALTLAHSEYVTAARALGASPMRIMVRHILPNMVGVLVVVVALAFAQNLLAEAALSYLGLGPPPPAPTWGRMLYEGRVFYRTSPHLVIAPAMAILIAVITFNLVADGLRDALDPKERR